MSDISLTFERSFDYELVRSLITHPKIYRPSLLADGYPSREEYRTPEGSHIWYVLARNEAGSPVGVFVFFPEAPERWDSHMALLPEAWGRGEEICLACFEWLRRNTTCRVLLATVPDYNRLMIRLARRLGMQAVQVLPDSLSQNSILYGKTIYSLPL